MNTTRKFQATCMHCQATVTTTNGGRSWRHDVKPATAHHAHGVGTWIQI